MVYRFKYDDDDSSEINKQLASSGTLQKAEADNTTTTTITESSSSGGFLEMAITVGGVAVSALAAGWGLYCLLSSSTSTSEKVEKMMKAPGKIGEYIARQPFEDNPREYFQLLRNSKR